MRAEAIRFGRTVPYGECGTVAVAFQRARSRAAPARSLAGSDVVGLDGPATSVGDLTGSQGWESEVAGDNRLRHDHRLGLVRGRVARCRADGPA
jgi:hypothetical protein